MNYIRRIKKINKKNINNFFCIKQNYHNDNIDYNNNIKNNGGIGSSYLGNISPKTRTPILDNIGKDLTIMALEGKLDPIIGRNKEVERISQILNKRKKNNPLLIGEPGVGKSAIAEGLALKIIQRQVSRSLYNKRIITLDISNLVAGTKYRGQFEEKIKSIINELRKNIDIIVFIDEIHTIIGAGNSSGSLDASNIFKPALARGEIQCIGATTLNEYKQYIQKDGALDRRFEKVFIEPTSEEETIDILNNIKDKYQSYHSVIYTDNAIKACVYLTSRYITDRNLPDKAIDALDEAGSRVHIKNIKIPLKIVSLEKRLKKVRLEKSKVVKNQKYEEASRLRDKEKKLEKKLLKAQKIWEESSKKKKEILSEDNVAEVVSMMSGIPVHKLAKAEIEKLSNIDKLIKEKIIGQNEAIEKVVKSIQRNRIGLKDPNRPIGSFIFIGGTGIGKTKLAQVLSEVLFNSENSLVRINMGEYIEKFSASRLLGSPPGYIGYDQGGQLTEIIRRKPYSVILLDEIEKAHPDIHNILLQILDDGIITDSSGYKIDFKNTVIIMTSNIGNQELNTFSSEIGFTNNKEKFFNIKNYKIIINKYLNRIFSLEFLNRIDDIIFFNSLKKEDISLILEIELKKLFNKLLKLDLTLKISNSVKEFIINKGYDKKYGARYLKRYIQKIIEDPLAEHIINMEIKQGNNILLELNENKVKFTVID